MTHIIQVDHESNIASNSCAELSLTGGQPEASGWSGTTRLPSGWVHVLPSLLTVIGQNLSIPWKHKVSKIGEKVSCPSSILAIQYVLCILFLQMATSVFYTKTKWHMICVNAHQIKLQCCNATVKRKLNIVPEMWLFLKVCLWSCFITIHNLCWFLSSCEWLIIYAIHWRTIMSITSTLICILVLSIQWCHFLSVTVLQRQNQPSMMMYYGFGT